jgi:hypothetical protein
MSDRRFFVGSYFVNCRSIIATLAAAIMFAACSGPGSSNASGPALASSRITNADAALLDLTYASTDRGVEWYKFPGARIQGAITGGNLPFGMCKDTSNNVYIAYGVAVYEFPHASDSYSKVWNSGKYLSFSCAVDPITSDLAVVNTKTTSQGPGNIAIYLPDSTTPTYYTISNIPAPAFAGYDNHGNLFVDGTNNDGFGLAELPAGGSAFTAVAFKHKIGAPGGVEWDGSRLAIGDGSDQASKIYRISVSNFTATVKDTVSLSTTKGLLQFDIFKKQVVVASQFPSSVSYYAYPKGGAARKSIQVNDAYGVVVSPGVK